MSGLSWRSFNVAMSDDPISRSVRESIVDIVESPQGTLNLPLALRLLDELQNRGAFALCVAVSAIYERLFRRKGLYLTLELLDFLVKNMGMRFIRTTDDIFFKGLTRLLKLASLNEQTATGQIAGTIKSIYKGLASTSPTKGTVKDIALIRVQKRTLQLIQLWNDSFGAFDGARHVVNAYRKLQRRGHVFPPRDPLQPTIAAPPAATALPTMLQDKDIHDLATIVSLLQDSRIPMDPKVASARICRLESALPLLRQRLNALLLAPNGDEALVEQLISLQQQIQQLLRDKVPVPPTPPQESLEKIATRQIDEAVAKVMPTSSSSANVPMDLGCLWLPPSISSNEKKTEGDDLLSFRLPPPESTTASRQRPVSSNTHATSEVTTSSNLIDLLD